MDTGSPLSNIDVDEVIADSEDEGFQVRPQDGGLTNDQTSLQNRTLEQATLPHVLPHGETTGEIDYFAGFQGAPIPSIAERAKMRQRKTKIQPTADILELTDEDELILKPQTSKTKKKTKPKERNKKSPPTIVGGDHDTHSHTTSTFQSTELEGPLVINAKPKVRPKPVKKTQLPLPQSPVLRTSQATIPVPTSPFAPPPHHVPYAPHNSPHFDLPPSDPPSTSFMAPDKDMHLPPIEFLRPPQTDSDTLPPSSLPDANIDELHVSNLKDQLASNPGPTLPPLPPTFFAGSSSSPVINALIAPTQQPLPLPVDIVDMTDIPATAATSSIAPDITTNNIKAKKPRKPRKKKEAPDDTSVSIEKAQPTTSKKKGNAEIDQLTVEVILPPLPPPKQGANGSGKTSSKRKGKGARIDDVDEDELNIGLDLDDIGTGPAAGPSFLPNDSFNNTTSDGASLVGDNAVPSTKPPKTDGRKRKKRQDPSRPHDSSLTTLSPNKRKKTSVTPQDDRPEEDLPALKKASKKRVMDGEEHVNTVANEAPSTTRITKGKRRMIIASEDEDDTQSIVNNPPPSPQLQELRRGSRTIRSSAAQADVLANANESEGASQDDRDVLKLIQPGDVRSSPFDDLNKTVIPQQRFETPSVSKYPDLPSRYTIAPKTRTSSMSELIRRANSHPSSPFPVAAGRGSPIPGLAYSPYLKSSRRTLSRIAPLHPNRKTPPPPLPPPPPRKKSKKELDLEEKWEEEIIEEIGGITEWLALSESEKKGLKRMKRDREMGYCED